MLKYFPLLSLFFLLNCGGDDTTPAATTQPNTPNRTTTAAPVDRVETPEQMQEITRYALETQRRVFNMTKEQSLTYTVGNNVSNFELYQEDNGDTLTVMMNGALGEYGESDRYIFYRNNRPIAMLIDRLKRDISRQMYSQILTFYNSDGSVNTAAMVRNNERKADMLAQKFIPKEMSEVHNVYKFVDEFKEAMENTGRFTLYFDDFITEGGRDFLRFKVTDDPTSRKYLVTAVRLPEDFRTDPTLVKVEKNPTLYQNKRVNLEWETIKMKNGQRIPQWVSGTFE